MQAILFDCFGVLYVNAREAYFSHFPKYYDELHNLNKQADHGFIDQMSYIATVASLTGESEESVRRAIAEESTANTALLAYIRDELKPHYKIGMISNIGRGWIDDFFSQHELHDLFDAVVLSGEEGITKPNPLIYERALERLNVFAANALFIDDNPGNCEGARSVGMKSETFTNLNELRHVIEQENARRA